MKRGILTITVEEFVVLVNTLDIPKYVGTTIGGKLGSVGEKEEVNKEVRLQLSEEEIETLLDDIGIADNSNELISVRKKMSDMLLRFRNDF